MTLQQQCTAIFLKALEECADTKKDDVIKFFIESYEHHLNNKTSLFGFRVQCKNAHVKTIKNVRNTKIKLSTDIVNENNEVVIEKLEFNFSVDSNYDFNFSRIKNFMLLVIELGLNGYLTSFDERVTFKNELAIFINEEIPNDDFYCNDCQKQFSSAKRFMRHIIAYNHEKELQKRFGLWQTKRGD